MRLLLLSILILSVFASSVLAEHSYTERGYWIPSYNSVYIPQGIEIVKGGAYSAPVARADYRKSAFRPVTYSMIGHMGANPNPRLTADTGAGLYVHYQYGNEMPSQIINIRNRMAYGPYYGAYGVEKQVIKPFTFGRNAVVSNAMPVPGYNVEETIVN